MSEEFDWDKIEKGLLSDFENAGYRVERAWDDDEKIRAMQLRAETAKALAAIRAQRLAEGTDLLQSRKGL